MESIEEQIKKYCDTVVLKIGEFEKKRKGIEDDSKKENYSGHLRDINMLQGYLKALQINVIGRAEKLEQNPDYKNKKPQIEAIYDVECEAQDECNLISTTIDYLIKSRPQIHQKPAEPEKPKAVEKPTTKADSNIGDLINNLMKD